MKYLIMTPQGHYLIGQRVPGAPGERPTPLWTTDLQAAQLFESPDAAFAATVYMQAGQVFEAHTVRGPLFQQPDKTEVAKFPLDEKGFGGGMSLPQGGHTGGSFNQSAGGAVGIGPYKAPENEHLGKTGGAI